MEESTPGHCPRSEDSLGILTAVGGVGWQVCLCVERLLWRPGWKDHCTREPRGR